MADPFWQKQLRHGTNKHFKKGWNKSLDIYSKKCLRFIVMFQISIPLIPEIHLCHSTSPTSGKRSLMLFIFKPGAQLLIPTG